MIKYIDKNTVYIDDTAIIEDGVIIYPNVIIEGNSKIKKNSIIHMNSYIKNSIIEESTIVYSSHIVDSKIGPFNKIGPYSNIRENTVTSSNVKIGSFTETKNSIIDENTKIPHLSYVGDSIVGKNVNIGCGVITANYDGRQKNKTIIKDDVFIGCNSNLIAPITLEKKSKVAAGSTIYENVPANSLAIARERQVNKENYHK